MVVGGEARAGNLGHAFVDLKSGGTARGITQGAEGDLRSSYTCVGH